LAKKGKEGKQATVREATSLALSAGAPAPVPSGPPPHPPLELPPVPDLRQLVNRFTKARLCYGNPVKAGDRTIVPVASVRAMGGGGAGRTADQDSSGGGGGGMLSGRPVGFIEVSSDGARFRRIVTAADIVRGIAAVGGAAAALAVAGDRLRRPGRRPRRSPLRSLRR
jgi:hypothetical protein